ncbi:AbgT family transporter [Corynebacterium flavescens]|uniref:AbgT family transporter n=1 Tax=Corynebacterium flavescens TaxID=28028 RepID=UPI003FCFBAD9
MDKFLSGVEYLGNKLPQPFTIFLFLFVLTGVISSILAWNSVTVVVPGTDEEQAVKGLFTGEGLTWFTTTMGANYINFPPLATVLPIMLAVGVAERSGMLSALIRRLFGSAKGWVLPYAVGIIGVTASIMADAAFVIVPPLAAMVFKAAGRHPVAGLIGGFAAVGAGYSTAMVPTSLDALFAGITGAVMETLPSVHFSDVNAMSNYFFNVASSIVLGILAGFIIAHVVEPRMWKQNIPTEEHVDAEDAAERGDRNEDGEEITAELKPIEKKGLVWTGIATIIVAAIVIAAILVPGSPWRNETGGFLPKSPLMSSIVFLVFLFFLVFGVVYGRVVGTVKGIGDVVNMMIGALKDMMSFLILAFIVLASLLNLLIISGSSMWTLMAAVFVPMFALLGYEPAFVQGAFRVGDSATQIITPLNPYMIVMLGFLQRYEPKAGLGTLISRLIPFVIPFFIAWTLVLAVWFYADLPLGPGNGIMIEG